MGPYHITAGTAIVVVAISVGTNAVAFDAVSALCLHYSDGGRWRSARDGGHPGTGAGTAVAYCS
jgi:hypothetical protein